MKNMINLDKKAMLFAMIVLLAFVMGCTQPEQNPNPVIINKTDIPNQTIQACNDKDCFTHSANRCENASIIYTNDAGTFNYTTSNCIFTKTLVTLNSGETEEMKKLLQGKNMTCIYNRGNFDDRLVTSLIFGMEYCNGDLKEALGELIIFTK